MSDQMTVLVVDDEPQVRSMVCYVLETRGYNYREADTIADAYQIVLTEEIDLVIMDVMLPDGSGVELCRQLRSISKTPIIILSALGSEEERIAGLEAGADDYVTKPFSPRELGLRVDVTVRRQKPINEKICLGDLELNLETGKLSFKQLEVGLTTMESRALLLLLNNVNRTVTFQSFLDQVWDTAESVGGREMVRITVHRIRARLRSVGIIDEVIQSVRGRGYRFNGSGLVKPKP